MITETTTDALAGSPSEPSGKVFPEMIPGGFDCRANVVVGVNPRRPRTWSGTSVGA